MEEYLTGNIFNSNMWNSGGITSLMNELGMGGGNGLEGRAMYGELAGYVTTTDIFTWVKMRGSPRFAFGAYDYFLDEWNALLEKFGLANCNTGGIDNLSGKSTPAKTENVKEPFEKQEIFGITCYKYESVTTFDPRFVTAYLNNPEAFKYIFIHEIMHVTDYASGMDYYFSAVVPDQLNYGIIMEIRALNLELSFYPNPLGSDYDYRRLRVLVSWWIKWYHKLPDHYTTINP